MLREIRVTIEVLNADGTTADERVVLTEASDAELEPGGHGDIEAALDELLGQYEEIEEEEAA